MSWNFIPEILFCSRPHVWVWAGAEFLRDKKFCSFFQIFSLTMTLALQDCINRLFASLAATLCSVH